jgi:hypothetical protein
MLTAFITLFSLFMAGVGLFGLLFPHKLAVFVSRWESEAGLWTAAALRVIFGLILWQAAPESRAPQAVQALAVITIAAGGALPFIGLPRFLAVLAWWRRQPPALVRVWCLFPILLGSFLLWAVLG